MTPPHAFSTFALWVFTSHTNAVAAEALIRRQKPTEDRKLEIAFLHACVQALSFTFG